MAVSNFRGTIRKCVPVFHLGTPRSIGPASSTPAAWHRSFPTGLVGEQSGYEELTGIQVTRCRPFELPFRVGYVHGKGREALSWNSLAPQDLQSSHREVLGRQMERINTARIEMECALEIEHEARKSDSWLLFMSGQNSKAVVDDVVSRCTVKSDPNVHGSCYSD